MKKYIFLSLALFIGIIKIDAQDVGVSGGFFSSMINVNEESELTISFSNNSFDTPIPVYGAYVQIDFPTTGEYSAPENPPTGEDSQKFNWSQNSANPNIWIGVNNTVIPVLSTNTFKFTVLGESITNSKATLLFADLSSGSDNNPNNNNAEPLLAIDESLPVELVDFSARSLDCQTVALNWTTATEINNTGFEILFSEDGARFERIGFIEAKGDSYSLLDYSFSHDISMFKNGQNLYYQLKQIDINGFFSVSDISSIKKECGARENFLSIGPNPTFGNLNFQFSSEVESDIEVVILNSNLQLVKRFVTNTGDKSFNKDISDLPTGVYIVKTKTKNDYYSRKIVLID